MLELILVLVIAVAPDLFDGNQPCVISPGDLDGDSIPDIVVAGRNDREGLVWAISTGTKQVVYQLEGVSDRLGRALAPVGDVNGDGCGDFVLGAYNGEMGYALIVSGLNGEILARVESGVMRDGFGASIGGGGDLNGDGTPDFLVGSIEPGHEMLRAFDGKTAELLFRFDPRKGWSRPNGKKAGMASSSRKLGGKLAFKPNRQMRGPGFATSLAIFPDIDHDGVPEVIVGSATEWITTFGRGDPGVVTVLSPGQEVVVRVHRSGENVHHGAPPDPTDIHSLGWRVGNAGDVNHDGTDDYYATAVGEGVSFFSGASGKLIWDLDYCAGYGEGEGTSIAIIEHYPSAGLVGLVVGTHETEEGWISPNSALRYDVMAARPAVKIRSGRNGIDVCSIPDVNGDAFTDLVTAKHFEGVVEVLDGQTHKRILRVHLDELDLPGK